MKQRRLLRFHGLRRPRVRQTWNKYNLYNLVRLRTPYLNAKTFFQQKWIAKSYTRGYHGEHIKEYQWERMFSRRPLSAVNMDPAYMARRDGSEQASGRGSGLVGLDPSEKWSKNRGNLNQPTPYMQMSFAPMERRLDIAIFRALFASSARQARQFVLHGAVKVNGKKMLHPGYLLNPGDMFQVDPKRVMTATGKPDRSKPKALKVARPRLYKPDAAKAAKKEAAEGAEEDLDEEAIRKQNLEFFEELKKVAYSASNRYRGRHLQAKDKQYLRKMVKEMKSVLAKAVKPPTTATATDGKTEKGDKKGNWFASKIEAMLDYLSLTPAERQNKSMEQHVNDQSAKPANEEASSDESKSKSNKLVIRSKLWKQLSSQQRKNILKAFQGTGGRKARGNSLPYRPRDWMSPFAFIPRYLEVNHRICAAVYLRHPVARPGLSEVPTPFSPKIAQLAFNWYLRRS